MSDTPVGALRHVISIETPNQISDGQGGFTRGSYTTFLTGSAEIKPLSARELFYASQKSMPVTHRITMRWRKDKIPTVVMRVNFTLGSVTRLFMITGIINVTERNRWLLMMCTENVGT